MFRNLKFYGKNYILRISTNILSKQNGNKVCFSSFVGDKDFQYLQRSIVPTDHFQDSLPRLPIPELEKTCERYLSALEPFISKDKLQKTKQIVEKFRSNEGKELQEELKASNAKNKGTSYISGPWFDMYLKSRKPLVLNFNPFLAFKDDPKPKYNSQLLRATNMILSSLRFMKSLQENILEPEVFHLNPDKSDTAFFRKTVRLIPRKFSWYGSFLFKAYPLDMSQFQNLFRSTRIPRPNKDEIRTFPNSRHMVVLRNGHFYVFDALDADGNILPPAHIHNHISYILSESLPPPSHPVSLLTSEERDTWASARQRLVELGNAEQLELVDSALFALALDDETLGGDLVGAAHHMLHGPVHNRWFDKSFTLILSRDGKAALNFEHAWGDGVAVLRYFNDVFADSTSNHFVGPKTVPANVDASHRVRRLEFTIDDGMKMTIDTARKNLQQATSKLTLNAMQHPTLTRDFIKNSKLSPDSVLQLGLQMAYYKLHSKFVATYESCSTSSFKHGRTETVRPLTNATRKCVQEFHKSSNRASNAELRGMLKECSKVHNQLTKDAATGQGFDRHLFALKDLAEKRGGSTPAIYTDPSYAEANHYVLSTSTLFGPAFSGGGFAPVVEDGYGIGYGFLDGALGCLVSAYGGGTPYAEALTASYDEIHSAIKL